MFQKSYVLNNKNSYLLVWTQQNLNIKKKETLSQKKNSQNLKHLENNSHLMNNLFIFNRLILFHLRIKSYFNVDKGQDTPLLTASFVLFKKTRSHVCDTISMCGDIINHW